MNYYRCTCTPHASIRFALSVCWFG